MVINLLISLQAQLPVHGHEPAIELAEKLVDLSPFDNAKVFFGSSGSDANDTQIKLFWYINNALGKTKKKKFLSRVQAYHGHDKLELEKEIFSSWFFRVHY